MNLGVLESEGGTREVVTSSLEQIVRVEKLRGEDWTDWTF